MKLKIDENLPGEEADAFRDAGHDAATVRDEGLGGKPDPTIASRIRREARAFVTLDLDFSDIRTYPPEQYAGLIVLRLARQDKPHVLGVIGRLAPMLAREDPAGHLWIVEEDRVRIRP